MLNRHIRIDDSAVSEYGPFFYGTEIIGVESLQTGEAAEARSSYSWRLAQTETRLAAVVGKEGWPMGDAVIQAGRQAGAGDGHV